MHLKWERSGAIWWVLLLCVIFFAVLILLPVLTESTIAGQPGTWTSVLPVDSAASGHAAGH
jgi:hypothetical protein